MNSQLYSSFLEAAIEETKHLTVDEMWAVKMLANVVIDKCKTIDEAEAEVNRFRKEWNHFVDWLVYRGGHHIALHKENHDTMRVLLIKENV